NLGYNKLTGAIPDSIGNLTNPLYLYLHGNNLSGSIPATFGNFANLLDLRLDSNNLDGTIPDSIFSLTNLANLDFHSNSLSGSITPAIGNLGELTSLNLADNSLTGTIPDSIGNLTNLCRLDVSKTNLTGQLPPTLNKLSKLENMDFDENKVTCPANYTPCVVQQNAQSVFCLTCPSFCTTCGQSAPREPRTDPEAFFVVSQTSEFCEMDFRHSVTIRHEQKSKGSAWQRAKFNFAFCSCLDLCAPPLLMHHIITLAP
ncbi:unnamed protein product, partial [Closterium sp. NIES-53]